MNDKIAKLITDYKKLVDRQDLSIKRYHAAIVTLTEILSHQEGVLKLAANRCRAVMDAAGVQEIEVEKTEGGILVSPGTKLGDRIKEDKDGKTDKEA